MRRLLVHVEGETEEFFVHQILAPYLYSFGYVNVSPRLIGNARQRDRRGGIRGWNSVRADILKHLKQDRTCISTIMVDYYALPQSGDKAWPGRAQASSLPFPQKASTIEIALMQDIAQELGEGFHPIHFIPYIMMHEFEGLLFSDCTRFAEGIFQTQLAPAFQSIRDEFATPEEINDSPITAPSKRVLGLFPAYTKPLNGVDAVKNIGLETIRKECPLFRVWLEKLQNYSTT